MNNIELIKQHISAPELIDMLNIEETRGRIHCPFHNDSRPSMKIYKNHFHCFACGAHHDIIGFTMGYLNINFNEALNILAEKAGININNEYIDTEHIITRKEIRDVIDVEQETCIEYHKQLIDLYNDYLDINNQYGHLLELYTEDRNKNDELWLKLNQYGIDTVIYNIKYFKKIEKILKENWEIPDNKQIYSKIKNNKELAKSLRLLLK